MQADYLRKLAGRPYTPPSSGQTVYEMACLPCHQPEGKGLPGVYPPLVGSDWVRGDARRLVKILLHGLTGPVTVAGQAYGGVDAVAMPSMGGLSNEQIADVLSFVRQHYGSQSGAVTLDEVKSVRSEFGGRETPWTAAELER